MWPFIPEKAVPMDLRVASRYREKPFTASLAVPQVGTRAPAFLWILDVPRSEPRVSGKLYELSGLESG